MDDKNYTSSGRVELKIFTEETHLGVLKVLLLIQVDREEKISRNWGTCLLFKLFLGTAVSSWQRKTPGEMDFFIFLKLFPKEKLHFESQNVSFPLANLNLICFTTDSTSVFRKH